MDAARKELGVVQTDKLIIYDIINVVELHNTVYDVPCSNSSIADNYGSVACGQLAARATPPILSPTRPQFTNLDHPS
jgi:hypothetical protein